MGLYLVELLTWLTSQKSEPLRIVECGTIRDPRMEGHEDGLSTLHIAGWLKVSEGGHEFYSFELEAGKIESCKAFLAEQGLDSYVRFGLGDAEKLLEHFCLPLDFAYLDAGADPFQNLAQFRRVQRWMRPPGFVVIDDVYDPRNADRGLVTVPFARLEGLPTAMLADRMAVIAFGEARDYPLLWK